MGFHTHNKKKERKKKGLNIHDEERIALKFGFSAYGIWHMAYRIPRQDQDQDQKSRSRTSTTWKTTVQITSYSVFQTSRLLYSVLHTSFSTTTTKPASPNLENPDFTRQLLRSEYSTLPDSSIQSDRSAQSVQSTQSAQSNHQNKVCRRNPSS